MATRIYELVNQDRGDIRAGTYPYNSTYNGYKLSGDTEIPKACWNTKCQILLSLRIVITAEFENDLPEYLMSFQRRDSSDAFIREDRNGTIYAHDFHSCTIGVCANDHYINNEGGAVHFHIPMGSYTATAVFAKYNSTTGYFSDEETVENYPLTYASAYGSGSVTDPQFGINNYSTDSYFDGRNRLIISRGTNNFSQSVTYSYDLANQNGRHFSYSELNAMNEFLLTQGNPHFLTSFIVKSTDDPNSYFTIYSGELFNIPQGMSKSSYYVSLSRTANPQSVDDSFFEDGYSNNNEWNFTWQNYYLSLSTTQKAQAAQSTEIPLYMQIWHLEGSTRVFDLTGEVQLYEDGRLLDVTSDPNVTVILREHDDGSDQGYKDSDETEDPIRPGQIMNVDNIATTTYICDNAAVRAFAMWLWRNNTVSDLEPVQVSPIENIISCKRIPFAEGGTNDQIRLGNLSTHIGETGTALEGHVKVSDSDHYQYIGSVKVPTFNSADKGSWIDMQNNISIYLPYCGIQSIPTGLVYKQVKDIDGTCHLEGRMLNVEYYYDLIYGTCAAVLSTGPIDNKKVFAVYNGVCGSDIPLTQSNRAQNQLAMKTAEGSMIGGMISGYITGDIAGNMLAGPLAGLAGATIGMAQAGISSLAQMENTKNTQSAHYTVSGGFSSQVASFLPSSVVLYIDHVIYTEPSSYAHDMGYPCYLTKKLSKLKGYTEIAGECDIKQIPCFEEERRAIKQALMAGFIL